MRAIIFGAAFLLLSLLPVAAHHSFDAEFDRDKPVELKGTVTKVEWMNPHVWFYADVTADNGEVQKWQFEMGAPNGLRRNGWGPKDLKAGDVVTIEGSLAKDGSNTVNARTVTLPNGRTVLAGSSGGDKK